MELAKKELIEKWKLICALRGINVFSDNDTDYDLYEILAVMQSLENSRKEKNPLQACADDLFQLGLDHDDYMEYDSLLDAEREAARDAEIKSIIDNNPLVQEARNTFNIKKVSGPKATQSYYTMSVPTNMHGVVDVKVRIVPCSWQRFRVWSDYRVPNEKKVHTSFETTWFTEHRLMNSGFPAHWRNCSAHNCGTNNIELTTVWKLAKAIKEKYKKKPPAKRKVKNV